MITSQQTVGQIASLPGVARELEKLGIDYCCSGGRTLSEACAAANLNVETIVARLEGTAAEPHTAEQDWASQPLGELIEHINRTHHAFVRSESPRILALLDKLVAAHGSNHPELPVLRDQFSALAEELSVHLMKEEQILFPYVVRLEESALAGEAAPPAMFGTVQNPIRMMRQEHDGAGDALRMMRSTAGDYKIPDDACNTYRATYEALQEFERDLHQHIHLENNILFPRAVAMEGGR